MSQQCALATKVQTALWGALSSESQPVSSDSPTILELAQSQFEYSMQFCAPQYIKNVKILESVQRKVTNLVAGLEGLSWEKRLSTPGLPSLEKRGLRGDLTALHCYGKGKQSEVLAFIKKLLQMVPKHLLLWIIVTPETLEVTLDNDFVL